MSDLGFSELAYNEAIARSKEIAAARISSESGADDTGESSNMNEILAAEAAVRFNQKMGGSGNMNSIFNNAVCAAGLKTVQHSIPDNYVGLIIGRKGEQIIRIQRETGCNVQIAQDSGGSSERNVVLSGTDEQIDEVKRMFNDIIEKAKYPTGNSNPSYQVQGNHQIEMSIPGSRAGLIIGKNGETIKQLQEQTGVKMVLIQDSNVPTDYEKPLRIIGDPIKVERAKQMVIDLLNARITIGGNANSGTPTTSLPVPSDKAGLVIGKGGETVKEIMRQSGARVEIQKQPSPNPAVKMFNIYGDPAQVETAIRLICDRANISAMGNNVSSGYVASHYGGDRFASAQWPQQTSHSQWDQSQPQRVSPSSMPAPTVNAQTGQPDYSAAWIEYYRRQGMHQQAEAILRHASQSQTGNQMGAVPSQHNSSNATAGGGNDFVQWQQYGQQWQQWQQQYVADGWNHAQARPGN